MRELGGEGGCYASKEGAKDIVECQKRGRGGYGVGKVGQGEGDCGASGMGVQCGNEVAKASGRRIAARRRDT